jgi:hypothetical protein
MTLKENTTTTVVYGPFHAEGYCGLILPELRGPDGNIDPMVPTSNSNAALGRGRNVSIEYAREHGYRYMDYDDYQDALDSKDAENE